MTSDRPSTPTPVSVRETFCSTRRIARIGGAHILRHRDGRLDIRCNSNSEREAALAWVFSVVPGAVRRPHSTE